MNKLIVFIGIFIFLLGLVSAEIETVAQPAKIGRCVSLPQQSLNASYENITSVQLPDYSKIYIGKLMTQNGADFNYTFCNISISGTYTVCGHSDIREWCYDFEATPSGFKNLGTFLFVFIIIIALIFILGFKVENAWIMSLGSILILLLGFFIIKFGVDIFKDTQTTWGIGIITWAIGLYTLFLSAEEQLKQWN